MVVGSIPVNAMLTFESPRGGIVITFEPTVGTGVASPVRENVIFLVSIDVRSVYPSFGS